MKIKKVGEIERHPLIDQGKQTNIKFVSNGVENVLSFAQNPLNTSWMGWDYWNPGMMIFDNKRKLNSFIKEVKENNQIIEEFVL